LPAQSAPQALPADWNEIGGQKKILPPKTRLTLKPGDVFSTIPHGGGGFGDPLDRNPENVRRDVVERTVSIEGARKYYGVVLSVGSLLVDDAATATLREELRKSRIGHAPAATALRRNMDRLGIVRANGHWQCAACDLPLGPVDQNPKEACSYHLQPVSTAGPLIAAETRGESKNFQLIEYSCPACGSLLVVDQRLKSDASHWHDVRLA